MRTANLLIAGLLGLAIASPVMAEDAHHPDKAAAQAQKEISRTAPEQTVKLMQGNVKKMQAQLDRLGKAKNDDEVQKIMTEHMQTMGENMRLAQGMAGMDCGMQGMGRHAMMGGGMGMMGGQGDMHDAMVQRMQRLEQRMDRMEQMNRPAPAK